MQNYNWRKAKMIEKKYKEQLYSMNPTLCDKGGIYFLIRTDENGFKYAYIGQSKDSVGVLTRLAQHMASHKQHIDNSLSKHKLYDAEKNPYGWKANAIYCNDSQLDKLEQKYIKKYADAGFQLRNVSLGGQGAGRDMIADTKPRKGYRDGLQQGKLSLARDLKHIIDLHLNISLKKPDNKVSQKAFKKFNALLDDSSYKK